jgi:hypothetical protein
MHFGYNNNTKNNICQDTKTFFVAILASAATIFGLEDVSHLFGGLCAAAAEPALDEGVEACTEKGDVVVDVLAVEILLENLSRE